ncbi:DNA cytosine methyltransferase [Candidatus Tisiphia endosymbiont of Xenochironomus xenolabis]|uniref:DNA cytosine methyltransferase n=1 Tax=unclassified Candidatus Tisiphia TaxID=2996318 RepID=UPI0035C8AF7E
MVLNKGGQGERIYSPLGHSITLSAFGGGAGARTGLYYINNNIRRLSISECKSLMGFSQSHYVTEGLKGYQQLGNAVIPRMIGSVYDSIKIL